MLCEIMVNWRPGVPLDNNYEEHANDTTTRTRPWTGDLTNNEMHLYIIRVQFQNQGPPRLPVLIFIFADHILDDSLGGCFVNKYNLFLLM